MSQRSTDASSSSHRWMTLGEASNFLGVDVSTLRAWADAGRIHAFRTPGGHRRFARGELDAFVSRKQPRGHVQLSSLVGRSGAEWFQGRRGQQIRGERWYAAIDSRSAEGFRRTCRQLMRALAGYISGGPRKRMHLRAGERASQALGASVASLPLTPTAAIRAFLSFRELITRTVSTKPVPLDQKVRSIQHIDTFLNRALIRMMNAYEQRRTQTSRALAGETGRRRTWRPNVPVSKASPVAATPRRKAGAAS